MYEMHASCIQRLKWKGQTTEWMAELRAAAGSSLLMNVGLKLVCKISGCRKVTSRPFRLNSTCC